MTTPPDILITQGYEARREHRSADAKRIFTEAIDLCRKADDPRGLARALSGLAQIERDLRDFERARPLYEEAVSIYRSSNDRPNLAHTVRHLGDILRHQGRLELAEPCYLEALQIYRNEVEAAPLELANTIRGFALLKGENGETKEALSLWEEAKKLYATVNVQAGVAESDRQIALLTQG